MARSAEGEERDKARHKMNAMTAPALEQLLNELRALDKIENEFVLANADKARADMTQTIQIMAGMGVLALLIGIGCRLLDIPLPAPPRLEGALLVVAMTAGFLAGRWWLAH